MNSTTASASGVTPRGSKWGLVICVLTLTAVAGGGGWFMGDMLNIGTGNADASLVTADGKQDRAKAGNFESRSIGQIFELKPIVTNLAAPKTVWVRFEGALVAGPGEVITPDIVAHINDDFLAFLRSANLMQFQGAAGLASIRTDLEERARLRSEGKVERVFISTLVVE